MDEQIRKLVEVISESERVELQIYQNAMVKNASAYNEKPTAARARNLESAKAGLQSAVDRLWGKYFSREPGFKNTMEAVRWLQGQGYKVKKSKVYNDVKAGILAADDSGRIRAADVKAYAAMLPKVKDRYGGDDEHYRKKVYEEIRQTRARAEKLEFELERDRGRYVLKDDVRTETAVKIAALEAGLKHMINTRAVDWIQAVGGKVEKGRMLINLFVAELDELLNEFGSMEEIGVVIRKGTETRIVKNHDPASV